MKNTPITYLSSPGANEIIIIKKFGINLNFNSVAYANGGACLLKNGSTAITGTLAATAVTSGVSNCNGAGNSAVATITGSSLRNQAVLLTNNTASFTSGNSNVNFWCIYSIESFSLNITTNSVNNVANAGFAKTEVIIPSASVQGLGTTPVSILPSPGSGKAIIPNFVTFLMPYNSVQYNSVNLSLVYNGQSTAIMSTGSTTFMSASNDAVICVVTPTLSNVNPTAAGGLGIDILAGGTCGSGNSPIKVILGYSVITL
jgi:hypothetical protein